MVFDWPFLVLGIVLLWFPRQWMRLGKHVLRRKRSRSTGGDEPWARREPGDPRLSFIREFAKARNYFDLLRGAAGSLAIAGWGQITPSITAAPGEGGASYWTIFTLKVGIIFIGLLIQIIRTEHHRITFFAAVFFIAGISVPLCGPWAAIFAFVLVWGANPMFNNAQAFLSLYSILLIAFGMLLRGIGNVDALAAGLMCFFPTLVSMLSRKPLLVFSRRGFRANRS